MSGNASFSVALAVGDGGIDYDMEENKIEC
jgi:hypothetical protein